MRLLSLVCGAGQGLSAASMPGGTFTLPCPGRVLCIYVCVCDAVLNAWAYTTHGFLRTSCALPLDCHCPQHTHNSYHTGNMSARTRTRPPPPPLPSIYAILLLSLLLLLPTSSPFVIPAARPRSQSRPPCCHPHTTTPTTTTTLTTSLDEVDPTTTTTLTTSLDEADERFMRLALVEAQAAFAAREIPVGAVLVSSEGQVLATGRNRVEATGDASAHAELECLRAASHGTDRQANGHWRMLDCTLYVTLEPCLMCLGAVQSFRVKRVVYGAHNTLLGAIESYIKVLEQAPHPFHAALEVRGGVQADECGALMKRFFAERREEESKRR